MAFVSLQGGNRYKGKTGQTSTNESDSAHALPVILQIYVSSSTVSTMSRHSAQRKREQGLPDCRFPTVIKKMNDTNALSIYCKCQSIAQDPFYTSPLLLTVLTGASSLHPLLQHVGNLYSRRQR